MMINGTIFIPKDKHGPLKLTNATICKHLNKRFSIGVFAGEFSSKFVCFDIDDGNTETVAKVVSLICRFGIPADFVYVSSSGGKGYHVEVFFDSLVYTEKLRIFYDWVTITGKLDQSKVEFRPTKNQAIKLPLSRHAKTGNICWYLDRETLEPIEREGYICEIRQFSAADFNSLVEKTGRRHPVSGGSDEDFAELVNPDRPKIRDLTEQERAVFDGSCPYPDIVQPGQRHHLTRTIAIRNRSIGMSLEESTEALLKWWSVQDRSITTTSDEEAISDIHDLVAWTFSDRFVVLRKEKKLDITKDLLRLVFAQENKTDRKFMFLLGCFCSVYGRMNMSYERIAVYLNCSPLTIKKKIPLLVEEGWINYMPGRTTNKDGKYVRKANTYWLDKSVYEGVSDLNIEFTFEDPMEYTALEEYDTDDSGRMRSYIPELEPDGFDDFYYEIIRRTLTDKSINTFLTRSEIERVRKNMPY